MNTREQFGNYILLKKIADDALGETFRAGRFGAQGIEQVVLLRVFNGQGLDGQALWQKVAARRELHGVLRSPNLASGIDFGEIEGVPYAAYDYISGKNLASLIDQANAQHSPLPTDHALLITERIALGLTAALETRLASERLLHGFVVPDLVMISNEGEAKLLGFEVAPGLREMAASSAAARGFERYLAPEALAGQPPHKSDDVYSLGAILYELLTARTLPPRVDDLDALLAAARVASESEPIPPGIRQLLQRSLASREQRIGDAASWHKALSQTMIEGQYNPTTFNLAFFMHSLFRDDIEKESRELQSEQKIEAPASTAEMAAGGDAAAGTAAAASADTLMVSSADIAPETGEEPSSKKGLFAALAAVLLLAVAGALYFFVFAGDDGPETAEPPVAASPAVQEPPPPSGPTQEEIQAELDRMRAEMAESLSAQSEEMQAELEKRYEERLRRLQDQYEQAQREEAARLAAAEAAAESEPEDEVDVADAATEPAADAGRGDDAPAGGAGAAGATGTTTIAQQQPRTQVAETRPQPTTTRTAEPPPPAAAQPAAPPPPAEPAVRRGQLVSPGPGVVPPRLLEQASARYPAAARRFRREATVTVRVLVDENGKVTDTELVGKKAGLGLDEAALSAARRSTFRPATKSGVPVKMWHALRFDFKP